MTEMVDLLIQHGLILTQDNNHRILSDTDIAVKSGQIVSIGKNLPYQCENVIDASQKVVMPGLVDSHMHETLTRGVCEDLPLNRWLDEICFPLDRSHTYDTIYAAALMNQLEMIRGGITTFIDIYRFPGACAEVATRSGLRGIFVPQIMISPSDVGESIESAEEFINSWKDRSPLITPGFGPHAPYSLPPEGYARIAQLAEKYDVPIHTHLSETLWEVGLIREQYHCTATEMLLHAGVLSPRLSVAHGVHLTPEDVRLLVEHGVGLAYNPSSNMKMAAGIASIPKYLSEGLTVGLGTDSNLSNNNLDMFEEMRVGAFLQKLTLKDPAAMPVQTMLDMATRFSAKVLNMEKLVGSLEIGKQADIILVDLDQPHLWPLVDGTRHNIEEQIVYSASAADVSHTIVAGRVLMAERKVLTLDEDEAFKLVQEQTQFLLKKAGLV